MEREKFELRVGIFVFVGIVMLGTIVMLLGSKKDMFSRQYPLYAEFGQVSGLKTGAPVRLSGVDVGTVEEISFPKKLDEKKLTIKMLIRSDVRDRIRQDSKASITTQGVLGDKFISISLGTEGPAHQKGDMLFSEQPANYLEFVETGGEVMNSVASIAKKLDAMLTGEIGDDAKKSIGATLTTLNEIVGEVKTGNGVLHKLIYDKEAARSLDNMQVASANLAALTTEMKNGKGALPALMNDPKSREALAKMMASAENLEKATADLKSILGKVERGEGTVGALINDDGVYDDLRALLGRAKRNKILRTVIRSTIDKNENLPKATPVADEKEKGAN